MLTFPWIALELQADQEQFILDQRMQIQGSSHNNRVQ